MAHTCNPSTLGGRDRRITRSGNQDHPGKHSETPSLLKIGKISRVWWHMPVVAATREAEAGESPEPRRWRLSEPILCHCTSAWVTEQDSASKKKEFVGCTKTKK